MAYDEELATRMRDALADEPGFDERRMFGGLAFLLDGRLAIAASGQGGALVRVDPAESDALVARTAAELAVMRGRPWEGWVRVPAEALGTEEQVAPWVRRAVDYVRTLPARG